jgi:hypothetical protein
MVDLATVLTYNMLASAKNWSRSITVERVYEGSAPETVGYRATLVTAYKKNDSDYIGEITEPTIEALEMALFRVTHTKLDWE